MANPNPFLRSPTDDLVDELNALAAQPVIQTEVPKPTPAPQAEAKPVSLPSDQRLPAGMRNNNPGNIKYVGQRDAIGPSVNRDQGDPQAVYATAEDGMAAMFRLASRKYKGGKTTANTLIASNGGWTPGNTQAAANVARTMGIGPDDDLNLNDPAMMARFGRALMLQEHGPASKAYPDDMIQRVAGSVASGQPVQGGSDFRSAAAPAKKSSAKPAAQEEDEPGRYVPLDPKAFQQQLDTDEPGRYQVITDDYAATHFSPALMDRGAYEQTFRQNNPGASQAAIDYAMAEFDKQQPVPAKAPPQVGPASPEEFFDQRLNQRLQQNGVGGIVPALPGKQDGLPSPGSVPAPTDPNQQGFFERAGDAVSQGMDNTLQSLGLARFAVAGGDSTEIANELAAKFAAQSQQIKTEGQKEIDAAFQRVTDADGAWDTTKAGLSAIGTALSNPKDLAVEIAGQAPNMLPTLATGAAGAGVGAGAGALAGGWGAIPGAIVGGRAGMAVGTTATELGAEVEQMVQERLAQEKKAPTAANIKGLLDSEDFRAAARNQGLAKGLTVAAVDQVFLGLGGKVAGAASRAASVPGKVALGAGAVATDATGEVAGEALSQQVARGEVNAGDALREGVMSLGHSAVEPVIGAGMQAATGAPAEAAPAQAPAKTVPPSQVQPVPAAAAPAPKSSTPLSSSLEDTAEQPQRVIATTPDGQQAAGTVLSYKEDENGNFVAQIVSDDGEVVTVTEADGVQLTPVEPPKGPLTASLETTAEQNVAAQAPAEPQAAAEVPVATEGSTLSAPVAEQPAAPVEAPAAPFVPSEPPAPTAPADMTDEQLRTRMKYLAGQFRSAVDRGVQKKIAVERRAIEKEINARARATTVQEDTANDPLRPGTDGQASIQPATPAGTADAIGAQAAAELDEPGRPGTAAGPGAGVGGLPVRNRESADAQPALTDEHVGRPFVSDSKARAYIAKNRIGVTHYVKRIKPGEFEIRRRPGAGATMEAAADKIAKQEEAVRKAAESLAARKAAKGLTDDDAQGLQLPADAIVPDAKSASNLPHGQPGSKKGDGIVNTPGKTGKPLATDGDTASTNSPVDAVVTGAELGGDVSSADALSSKGNGTVNVEASARMLQSVLSAIKDNKVFRAVIASIPVDVMDDLAGPKLTAKNLRSNKAMFVKALTANHHLPVGSRAMDAIVRAAAIPVAEVPDVDFGGASIDAGAAPEASNSSHGSSKLNDEVAASDGNQSVPRKKSKAKQPAPNPTNEGDSNGIDQRTEQQPDGAEAVQQQEAGQAEPEQASAEAAQEVSEPDDSEPADDLAGIPQAFIKRTKVPLDVWVQDEGVYETVDIPADQALASVREDITNLRSLLDCLRS